MNDNLNKLITDNYDLEIKDLKLIEGQFCEMYSIISRNGFMKM